MRGFSKRNGQAGTANRAGRAAALKWLPLVFAVAMITLLGIQLVTTSVAGAQTGEQHAYPPPDPKPAESPKEVESPENRGDNPLQADYAIEPPDPGSEPIESEVEWREYQDKYWAFKLKYPSTWKVQNSPYVDFGFRFYSPDCVFDPAGNPLEGSFLAVNVSPMSPEAWEQNKEQLTTRFLEAREKEIQISGVSGTQISGEMANGNLFEDIIIYTRGHLYQFSFVTHPSRVDRWSFLAIPMLENIELTGTPQAYPAPNYAAGGIEPKAFSLTPIKHAFQYGPGKIISGYSHDSAPNQYAFDLCEGSNCSQGDAGDYVIAPTDITLVWSGPGYGMPATSEDLHIFELDNDGSNRLCMQIGHFENRVINFNEGVTAPRGAAIGTLLEYPPSIPHLHMGMWTVPAGYICATSETNRRTGVPFTGNLNLDGVEYPAGESHQGKAVNSTNAPFCWAPPGAGPIRYANFLERARVPMSDAGDCFPPDPGNDTTPPSGYFTSPSNGSTITSRTATIAVSASDNAGGSGVREVRFSAVWPGGSWVGIGTDGSAPYAIEWDLCSTGVPDGDVELGMEVWDNAGNKYVWSEHGSNPHITKDYDCSGGGTPPGGSWYTLAWQNRYLAGYANWEGYFTWDDGNYPYIYFDWGGGAPFGWGGNEFSMRLSRDVYFPGGYYDFHTDHDDGVKVYVDGTLRVDAWWDGHGGHDAGVNLPEGYHEVRAEYYENTGDAIFKVWWYGPGYPAPDQSAPNGRITSPTHLSATNQAPLSIWAEATDDVSGVDRVDFFAWYCVDICDWWYLGTSYAAPYYVDWDWSSLSDMHIWLKIDVYDRSGKMSGDAGGWVEVDLDRTSPSASITSPPEGSYFTTDEVYVEAYAEDVGSGIDRIQFFAGYDDGSLNYWHEIGWDLEESDGWSTIWNASAVADQTDVSLFIYAYDRAWNYMGYASWGNVLDRSAPSSAVSELPASSDPDFVVSWTGSDATSGISDFDVQYADNDGPWTDWQMGVSSSSAIFSGAEDHSYQFRSRARDFAGNQEDWPAAPDAETTVAAPEAPANDDFDSAKVIGTLPYADSLNTGGATSSPDDPPLTMCNRSPGLATVWYKYTPAAPGILNLNTFGSSYDTMLAVWTGTRSNLRLVTCADDSYEGLQTYLEAGVIPGTTYFIEVAQYGSLNSPEESGPEKLGVVEPLNGGYLELYADFTACSNVIKLFTSPPQFLCP